MLQTYKAILHGDHVEWIEKPPEKSHPAQVHITFLEETVSEADLERGQAMAEALAALASRGTFTAITDPVSWQREMRSERTLPSREP